MCGRASRPFTERYNEASQQQAGGIMGIRAIAFHELIATDKIHELFGSPESQEQIETRQGKCVKCNLEFVIVLLAKSDPRNPEYVGQLNGIIAEDCIGGSHRDEYSLDEVDPQLRVH
jgi:hypothetical protein